MSDSSLDNETDSDMTKHHPSVQHLLDLFDYEHLPSHLQVVSEPCSRLAYEMADRLHDGIELSAALRHLLYAKDSFVRQAVIDKRDRDAGVVRGV